MRIQRKEGQNIPRINKTNESKLIYMSTTSKPIPGSHSLAATYPRRLFDDRGTDYELPVFPAADPTFLTGAKGVILAAHCPELPELDVPIKFLVERGAQVELACPGWIFDYQPAQPGYVALGEFLSDDICIKVDLRLENVNLADKDFIFIPGGCWCPNVLRMDKDALHLVQEAYRMGLLIASICHGPQVIINAFYDVNALEGKKNLLRGTQIIGTEEIWIDLENAGFVVERDQPVVYDEGANLLTARNPQADALGGFCLRLGDLLKKRITARS